MMNERIKELAEQSGFYFYDLHEVDGDDLGEMVESDSWDSITNLTNSVIRDCLDVISSCYDIENDDRWNEALQCSKNKIKERFDLV